MERKIKSKILNSLIRIDAAIKDLPNETGSDEIDSLFANISGAVQLIEQELNRIQVKENEKTV